ncbi:hypothetical protein BH10PSE12_BH10PSE12_10450 [soil metagenome]
MFATRFISTRFTATLAATLCLVAATPAFAGASEAAAKPAYLSLSEPNGLQRTVRYGDLNLASVDGQQALQQRIRQAANKVCPQRGLGEASTCRAIALRQAKAPMAEAIAQAQTDTRYAKAEPTRVIVGN